MTKHTSLLGQQQYLKGDFNRDGVDDYLKSTGTQWMIYHLPPGIPGWEKLTQSSQSLINAVVIDADGDGYKNDIIYQRQDSLFMLSGIDQREHHLTDFTGNFDSLGFRDVDGNGSIDIYFPGRQGYFTLFEGVEN